MPTKLINQLTALALVLAATSVLFACSAEAPVIRDVGPEPDLPPPDESLLPTVNIAPAIGWSEGGTPLAAEGLEVNAFAAGLDHPRWLYRLPNGDILVAESNAPQRSGEDQGLREWIAGKIMSKAGAGVPSADRITLLRDTSQDGTADLQTVFLEGLHSPFGMYLHGDQLLVANTDALLSFDYTVGATSLSGPGSVIAELPAGPINQHWTRNVIGVPGTDEVLVTVGSNSNIAENGMENEVNRAAILRISLQTGETEVFASGLRNPNGLAWQPESQVLWTTVNERDELGDNLVPDYMTSVREGAFYGWPYSYYGQNIDERVQPQDPQLVASAIAPDYALGAHTAALGLAFYEGDLLPRHYQNGAFIGQHGSWNRDTLAGYKVVFVEFDQGEPVGLPVDILTGFVNEDGDARGRPVGVIEDGQGALLVADDVGNVIWRVIPKP